jgi:predicted lipid-binding transport protein (Tim44 family)
MPHSLQERIRERAFEIWNTSGRMHGQAEQHWLAAEREVLAEMTARDQMSEVRGQRSEVRDQMSGVRRQRSDVRDQRSEIRDQTSEAKRRRPRSSGR